MVITYNYSKAPTGPPENLTFQEVTETSISLKWNSPQGCLHNGIIIGYTVHIVMLAPPPYHSYMGLFANTQTNNTNTTTGGLSGTQLPCEMFVLTTHADVKDLQPQTVYSITVAASTSVGTGPFSSQAVTSTLKSGTHAYSDWSMSGLTIHTRTASECPHCLAAIKLESLS